MLSRLDPRNLVHLKIKLSGTDRSGNRFVQTAFTRDVSTRGARLTQVPPFLGPAAVVNVEYHGRRSRFRVVWVGGTARDEVGLLTLEPGRCIWGRRLPGRPLPSSNPVPPPAAAVRVPTTVVAYEADRPGPNGEATDKKSKRFGYFCNDPDCRRTRAFHLLPDGKILFDIWPQVFPCPATGKRYEYSSRDVRSAGYL